MKNQTLLTTLGFFCTAVISYRATLIHFDETVKLTTVCSRQANFMRPALVSEVISGRQKALEILLVKKNVDCSKWLHRCMLENTSDHPHLKPGGDESGLNKRKEGGHLFEMHEFFPPGTNLASAEKHGEFWVVSWTDGDFLSVAHSSQFVE